MRLPPITLVSGGAASGKSAWAETQVLATGLAKVYVATAVPRDREMKARIATHRRGRAGQGWRTLEVPVAVPQVLADLDPEEIALVDCTTYWLSNLLGAGRDPVRDVAALIEVLELSPAPIVVVTSEIGQGMVPKDPAARAFRDLHGQMNQRLAETADLVVMVQMGLAQALKGTLP
ncbi:bifunctional adenosylcobinamide kinase/adenosylcobinamide-phosphate guanylyltransferase [Rhodobacterales bacterium HKCCE2091]|nr:bifunctional adenosylcobinamide kinase/adenosylcobinamide-phosphate guanylyltransferase [Rhodobacterales bacterium HKCCE2091]